MMRILVYAILVLAAVELGLCIVDTVERILNRRRRRR